MMYLGFFMVGVAILLAIAGLVQQNKAKKILAAPFKKTGEVAANPSVADAKGNISTEGAIATQQPINAPCSNQPCVYYELKVEKQVEESKMTDRGMQTTKNWKNVSEQKQGSTFYINDGSGPVAVQALDSVDADLKQSYSGAPPGGQGLGILANMLTGAIFNSGERIVQYRATEKIIPAQGNLFVMGKLAGGQITKSDGMMGKLLLSTKGRDGLVGHTKKMATILYVVGALLFVGGVPVSIFGGKPKDTSCKPPFTDAMAEACTGAMKSNKLDFDWKITKAGVYEVSFAQPSDATVSSWPTIVVMTKDTNWPMNNPFNLGISDQTVKVELPKGDYVIHVDGVDGSKLEGGFRYILNLKYVKALDDDKTVKTGKDDDGDEDDKGSADKKAADDDDDKGAAAATTTATAKPKTTAAPKTTTTKKK